MRILWSASSTLTTAHPLEINVQRTPLFEHHTRAGARMVPFGGWDMPVAYSDITTEHRLVRSDAGLFDLCHMGRIRLTGPDAMAMLQSVQTNDAEKIAVGRIRYALFLNKEGCALDDILIHRRANDIYLVVNASNLNRDRELLQTAAVGRDAEVIDESESTGMIAIQGPRSEDIVALLAPEIDVKGIPYYGLAEGAIDNTQGMITRTGYTGEDGFELYVPAESIGELWDRSLQVGKPHNLAPCGLGARDTLRLEAGMPLYGHEITEDVNPIEAGLTFGVRLKKTDYTGIDALKRIKADGPTRTLVGLTVEGRRIPRDGYPVCIDGEPVGSVASGTFSPTFEVPIATALVTLSAIHDDCVFSIDIRGKMVSATRVELPFYRRDGTGSLHKDNNN